MSRTPRTDYTVGTVQPTAVQTAYSVYSIQLYCLLTTVLIHYTEHSIQLYDYTIYAVHSLTHASWSAGWPLTQTVFLELLRHAADEDDRESDEIVFCLQGSPRAHARLAAASRALSAPQPANSLLNTPAENTTWLRVARAGAAGNSLGVGMRHQHRQSDREQAAARLKVETGRARGAVRRFTVGLMFDLCQSLINGGSTRPKQNKYVYSTCYSFSYTLSYST